MLLLYADTDHDHFGNPALTIHTPRPLFGWVPVAGGCNDADASINPMAVEVCGDGVDNDCDGVDDVCPVAALSPDTTWSFGVYVSSLGPVDLDLDGLPDAVVIGESDVNSWRGAFEQLDSSGRTFLADGYSGGDAAGYQRAVAIGGTIIGSSVNSDLNGIDSGSIYTLATTGRGPQLWGPHSSSSSSAYNAACAAAGPDQVLCGFATDGGDAGGAYMIPRSALGSSAGVSSVATASASASTGGLRLAATVGFVDLDGDSLGEWLLADDVSVHVLDGAFSGATTVAAAELVSLAVAGTTQIETGADLDGDGAADIVFVAAGSAYVVSGADVLAGVWAPIASVADAAEVSLGDFDGDGAADLAWVTATGEIGVEYGPLTGAVVADAVWTDAALAEHLALGDVDGDAIVDLVFSTDAGEILVVNGG